VSHRQPHAPKLNLRGLPNSGAPALQLPTNAQRTRRDDEQPQRDADSMAAIVARRSGARSGLADAAGPQCAEASVFDHPAA
jgi:hypothetical protein